MDGLGFPRPEFFSKVDERHDQCSHCYHEGEAGRVNATLFAEEKRVGTATETL